MRPLLLFCLIMLVGCEEAPQREKPTKYTFPDGGYGYTHEEIPSTHITANYPIIVNLDHVVSIKENEDNDFEGGPDSRLIKLVDGTYHNVIEDRETILKMQNDGLELVTLHQLCRVRIYVDFQGNAVRGQAKALENHNITPYGEIETSRWAYLEGQIKANP
jgi:hypothetical protein